MFELLENIGNFISTVFNAVMTLLEMLVNGIGFIFSGLTSAVELVTGLSGVFPPVIVSVAVTAIGVFVALKIIGRKE